ncbi:MAG TPA: MFS transporter [Vicinamibacteria bacterium]|nr:MFS transporter [Vicinamibacteria bacterium]
MTSIRWNILLLLFVASFVAYVLRTNLSIAGAGMMADLRISRVELGYVLAAFAWGYGIFQFPGGVLGDWIGARRALAFIAVSWGIMNLLVGIVPGRAVASSSVILAVLIVLRFLMGAAQAPLYPVTGRNICNWFPESGWAFPNGLTNAGLTLGSAATGPLIAWLMETVGWRQSFVITAPLAFLTAGVWWLYARDYPAEHPRVSPGELQLIDANRTPAEHSSRQKGAWKLALGNREVLLLTASYFCSNYVFYFFFNWLFIYLVDSRGFQVLEGGYYAAAPWITGAVGATLGGIVCDGLCRRIGLRRGCRWPSVLGLVLAGGLIGAAATSRDPLVAVVLLSLCLGCQQFTEGPYWAATIAVGGRNCAAACGVLNTGGNVVGGIGAILVPIIVELLGWGAALATASLFALIAAILWFFIDADRSVDVRHAALQTG